MVRNPQHWRELLNLIDRLPDRCHWKVEAARDPGLVDAAVAQALAEEPTSETQTEQRRPDWVTYTATDARLDRLGYHLVELLKRAPAPKGYQPSPAPLPAETPAQAAVREALDARDDAAVDALEADLGF